MTNEKTPLETNEETPRKRGMASKIGKTSYKVANVVMPLGEVVSIGKHTTRSLAQTASRIGRLMETTKAEKKTQLTFDQAVEASGRTEAQLNKKFLRLKRFWWVIALAGVICTPLLLIMILLAAKTLSGVTIIRAVTFVLIFAAITAIAATRVVMSQLRLWQLHTRRLTPEDRGTFNDFRRETNWFRQCLTPF